MSRRATFSAGRGDHLERRLASRSILALLLTATACGPAPAHLGSIKGRLVLRNAPPRQNVPIDVDGPEPERTATDTHGHYVFTDLLPGHYTISADLQLWSLEPSASVDVTVKAGKVSSAPDLVLTPAGGIRGQVAIAGGGDPEGFRIQVLGTELAAVADADGLFAIHRVAGGTYELVAERADVGSARQAGVTVTPFAVTDIGTLTVQPGGSASNNAHPVFDEASVIFTANGTPHDADVVPLPYLLPAGSMRRFDQVALSAPATDPDGDPLTYEWSASAGQITGALTDTPLWQPDAYAGSAATVSVTVRDGHGGIARLSSSIAIVDVFAGSVARDGQQVVHSYRIEGGPWRVDQVDLDTLAGTHLFDVQQTADPRPLLVGSNVVYRQQGDLWLYDPAAGSARDLGITPANDTVAEPRVVAVPPYIVLVAAASPNTVTRLDLTSDTTTPLFDCGGACTKLAARGGQVVAFAGGLQPHLLSDPIAGGPATSRSMPFQIGTGLALSSAGAAFVEGDSGRTAHNAVDLLPPSAPVQTVYRGYYDTIVWASGAAGVYITEQEYVALVHPPFIRLVQDGSIVGDFPADHANGNDTWMADRVYSVQQGTALVRRVASADWPEAFDASRSEIALVRQEAFQ